MLLMGLLKIGGRNLVHEQVLLGGAQAGENRLAWCMASWCKKVISDGKRFQEEYWYLYL